MNRTEIRYEGIANCLASGDHVYGQTVDGKVVRIKDHRVALIGFSRFWIQDEELIRVTDLTEGQHVIWDAMPRIIKWVDPYGERETCVTFTTNQVVILSNDNWFEAA